MKPLRMRIDVGQVLAKKYELVRLLGRGSMGEVWSAHHQALREQVAIKVLAWPPSGEDAEEPEVALARFRFEAQVAARLSRKTRHIARVTDYGEDDGLPYLVMELLDGEALDAALRQRGPFAPAEAAQIVSQIARALGQAHAESVAHRDLKPANVFLTRDEEGRLLVKLLDFGIARTIHAHRVQGTFTTAKGFVFGTPGYMSPEQTRASPKLDHRCDLWALATIAYQMVSGHLPVDGADAEEIMKNVCAGRVVPLRQRDPGLPEALGAFFDRAFADRLDDRFEGAALLAQGFELAAGVASARVPPSAPSAPDNTGSTATEFSASVAGEALRVYRRPRARVVLAAAAVVVAAIVALGGAWRGLAGARSQAESSGPADGLPSDSIVRSVVKPPSPPADVPSSSVASGPSATGGGAGVGIRESAAAPPSPASPQPPTPVASPSATPALRAAVARPPAVVVAPARGKGPSDVASPRAARSPQRPGEDRNDVF
jgi:serine/threonine protein kinase